MQFYIQNYEMLFYAFCEINSFEYYRDTPNLYFMYKCIPRILPIYLYKYEKYTEIQIYNINV